jgi:hypothetical protein
LPYELTINQENRPEGAEIFIHGLGTFENGSTVTISDEDELRFRLLNSSVQSVTETGEDGTEIIKRTEDGREYVEGVYGPTLEDAVKNMYGIEIKSGGDEKKEEKVPEGELTPAQQASVDQSMQQDIAEQGGGQ